MPAVKVLKSTYESQSEKNRNENEYFFSVEAPLVSDQSPVQSTKRVNS